MAHSVGSLPPFKFTSWLKPVIWGGDRIARFKGIDGAPAQIGESWEISALPGKESVVAEGPDRGLTLTRLIDRYGTALTGSSLAGVPAAEFPLLIKLIDARADLSLQVHPDNDQAARLHGCTGKTEMWYVIDADPEAVIYAGFSRDVTPDDYRRGVADGSIMEAVERHRASAGDIYFLPAGRIHAIGAGNFLIEIQRSSDITYRVYDYGRADSSGNLRPLHIDEAAHALDFTRSEGGVVSRPEPESPGVMRLMECEYFRVKRVTVEGRLDVDLSAHDAFVTLTCIAGTMWVKADGHAPARLSQGETMMIAASVSRLRLTGNAIAVSATLPQ